MTLPGRSRREGQHEEGQEGKTLPHKTRLARRTVRTEIVVSVIAIDGGISAGIVCGRRCAGATARSAALRAGASPADSPRSAGAVSPPSAPV